MRHAHDVARRFGEHRDIYRVLGHQVGDELVAVDRVEFVGFLETHAEKPARNAVPEGRTARLVDDAAQFGEDAVGEAVPVLADEQVARTGEQHA